MNIIKTQLKISHLNEKIYMFAFYRPIILHKLAIVRLNFIEKMECSVKNTIQQCRL